MKKVFAILAIAGFMAACNNSGEKKEAAKDSTAAGTTMSADTSSKMAMDTTAKMSADTTKK
jgi:hypothetical protein